MTLGSSLEKLFGKSPVSPLQAHMSAAHAVVAMLGELISAVQAGDSKRADSIYRQMSTQAREADKLKKALRMQARKSLFMPVARTDLLELLTSQDLVADYSQAVADLLMNRRMRIPEPIEQAFDSYLSEVISVCGLALDAVNELDEVFEVGLGEREIQVVHRKLQALEKREDEVRKLVKDLRRKIFRLEGKLEPLEAMFLYQLVDRLEMIARGSERIGNRLLILISI